MGGEERSGSCGSEQLAEEIILDLDQGVVVGDEASPAVRNRLCVCLTICNGLD